MSYTIAIFTIIFLVTVSLGVSPPRYQLTTLNYIYYKMNLDVSSRPVSYAYACNIRWIFILVSLTRPQLTSHEVRYTFLCIAGLDPYIQKFVSLPISCFVVYSILTIFIQLKHHDLHHPLG